MSNHWTIAAQRFVWAAVLVALAVAAPIVLLGADPATGAGAVLLISLAAGLIAFAGIITQFVLPSRARWFTYPFGLGPLLDAHRRFGIVVLTLIAIHAAVFVIAQPSYAYYLLPIHGPLKAQAGWAAAVCALLLVVTSNWRRQLGISYETWRLIHIVAGIVVLVGSAYHILVISWFSAYAPLRWYIVALFSVGAFAAVYIRVFRRYVSLNRPYVVTSVQPEHGRAVTLSLHAHGHRGTPFMPGQFAWLRLGDSPYALTEHPFSYASSATDPRSISFTIRSLGDFTGTLRNVRPGTRVLLDGPHGTYRPQVRRDTLVLIVAGIGITPAMSFIRTAAAVRNPQRMLLVHGARTYDDLTFREEIQLLAGTHPWLHVVWALSRPPAGWNGYTGRIDARLLAHILPSGARHNNYFVCGPGAMIESTLDVLHRLGVPRHLIHTDSFDLG